MVAVQGHHGSSAGAYIAVEEYVVVCNGDSSAGASW